MQRREWLVAVACMVLVPARTSAGATAGPEPPPKTIEQALDRLETLLSPEALAAIFAGSEEDLVEFERGIRHVMEWRWLGPFGLDPPARAKALASLKRAFAARGVDQSDRAAYLLSSLWRRRRGLSLDTNQQLAIFHYHHRRLSEAVDRYRRALPPGTIVTDLGTESNIEILDTIHFRDRTSEIEPGEGTLLLDALAATLKGNSEILLFEAQGHTGSAEPHAQALSLSRARAVKEGLVHRGVDASRVTAHGLGSRFTIPGPGHCPDASPWWLKVSRNGGPVCADKIRIEQLRRPDIGASRIGFGVPVGPEPDPGPVLSAPARDRRVDFVILRRKPRWPVTSYPASRDGGAGGFRSP